jgi:hypothetical protein
VQTPFLFSFFRVGMKARQRFLKVQMSLHPRYHAASLKGLEPAMLANQLTRAIV